MVPWAIASLVIGFIFSSAGAQWINAVKPQTPARLAAIETKLTLIERDLETMGRALWRLGATNEWRQR